MTTTVTTILSPGGDPQAWYNAAPDPTAGDTIQQLVVKNGVWTKGSVILNMTPRAAGATSATCYFEVIVEAGASLFDIAANPLHIDKTKGAIFEVTGEDTVIFVQVPYTRISGLQINSTAQTNNVGPAVRVTATGCDFGRLAIESYGSYPGLHGAYYDGGGNTLHQMVVIQKKNSTSANIINVGGGTKFRDVTAISLGATLANGITTSGPASTLTNVYVGGATNPVNAVNIANTITNCATDAATGSAGFTFNVPMSTANFVNVGATTYDFRRVAGSTLDTASIGAPYTAPAAANPNQPHLTGAAITATTAQTVTAQVGADPIGGTLYYLINTGPTATEAQLRAASTQAMVATGTQTVTLSNATPDTLYYAHFLQDNGGLISTSDSTGVKTKVLDTTPPQFPANAAITQGAVTSTSLTFTYPASTDTDLSYYETTIHGINATDWRNDGTGRSSTYNSASGVQAGTAYQVAARPVDTSGNRGNVITMQITTAAATTGSFKTKPLANNTGTLYAAGTAVAWQWHVAGRIGTAASSIAYGSGSIAADGTLSVSGLPLGSGYLLAAILGANLAADKPYYQSGTVA